MDLSANGMLHEGNLIILDGDRFRVSMMTEEQWNKLQEFIADNPHLSKYLSEQEPFIVYSISNRSNRKNKRQVNYFVVMGDKDPHAAYATTQKSLYVNPAYKEDLVGFRPILIPLTKDNKPDKSFAQQNPDGTITYGGQIMVNQKVYGITHAPEPIPIVLNTAPNALQLMSTTNPQYDVIKWLVFDGVLFPTRVLAMTTIRSLFRRNLLPVIHQNS